ncbi:DUF2264 domain-containing protein [Paenibacillus tarimensis]|uniref:DUF2264 domain-containing protein n=1 Tax=Paenibacillus tarimensis TaxID=416012 RepID=UPI001F488E2A|nr:DUF2264 domain-containing protein [Paenibacillus tarimensis]MCF2943033.1 DUF2264 domain-containing protein [Paenibacillus tarimensis]
MHKLKSGGQPVSMNPLRTKADLQLAVRQLTEPLLPYYSEGSARLHLGNHTAAYGYRIAELEGFSRVLWGLAPLVAGGGSSELWEIALRGIRNGTNPGHEEYWGQIGNYNQTIVEMAAFGYTLLLAPEMTWGRLSEQERSRLVEWLSQINGCQAYDCNWLFFAVLVNIGLKKAGAPYDQEVMERNLERIEAFYLSDGWYADGAGGHSDYYVPFAFHYYGLIYAAAMEEEDPARSQQYKERAARFAEKFIHWFAPDGSAIPYGRSLTYRFAQSAFWSALAYAGVEVYPMGMLKGLVLRNLRWWLAQPIFQSDGLLSVGYSYPNMIMSEGYNSPASPYWALKTFLPLVLGEDHPFWQEKEQPLPVLEKLCVQPEPHLVLFRREESGHVLAFNSGHPASNEHTHTSAKYEKFVYSNHFGFSVPRAEWGLGQGAYDSMLALSEGDNLFRVKRRSESSRLGGNQLLTEWKPWPDVLVKTWILPGLPWHVRVHRIKTGRKLDAAEGGFALGLERFDGQADDGYTAARDERGWARAAGFGGASGISLLHGSGRAELIYPQSNTNLLNPRTVIPTVRSSMEPGVHWIVTAVYGELDSSRWHSEWECMPSVNVEGNKLVIKMSEAGSGFSRSAAINIE